MKKLTIKVKEMSLKHNDLFDAYVEKFQNLKILSNCSDEKAIEIFKKRVTRENTTINYTKGIHY